MRHTIVALIVVAGIACSSPAAEQPPATRQAAKPISDLPDGWKARLDDPAAKENDVVVRSEEDAVIVTSGPAGIYYKPDMKAEKDYTVSATFSQLKPTTQPQPYGLFVSGADLDKDTMRYTALLVRGDGKFQILQWAGGKTAHIVEWKAAPSMLEPKGVKTTNTLTIRALQDGVHFLIGDKEVHQMSRARAGADGVTGVRVGPGLNVQITKFEVKKFP